MKKIIAVQEYLNSKEISTFLKNKFLFGILDSEDNKKILVDRFSKIYSNSSIDIVTDKNHPKFLKILNYTFVTLLSLIFKTEFKTNYVISQISINKYDFNLNIYVKSECDFKFNPLNISSMIKKYLKKTKSLDRTYLSDIKSLKLNKYEHKQLILYKIDNNKNVCKIYSNEINEEVIAVDSILCELKNIYKYEILNVSALQVTDSKFSKNIICFKVNGFAAWNNESFNNIKKLIIELKKYDHREINNNYKLYFFNDDIGSGFPYWTNKGVVVKRKIQNKLDSIIQKINCCQVESPIFGSSSLYEKSGHLFFYSKTMFPMIKLEHENLMLRPMTCPHHCIYFKHMQLSYKNIPFRIFENSMLFRYEHSGGLKGIERSRIMELPDLHSFIDKKNIHSEISFLIDLIFNFLKTCNIEIYKINLSIHNEKKMLNDNQCFDNIWNYSKSTLVSILKSKNIKFEIMKNEGAFYGDKIDFQVLSKLNQEITISTIQLDFQLPVKFNLSYVNNKNEKITPVIIHTALIGTYGRFLSILLEQNKGLPFWCSSNQIYIISINSNVIDYATDVFKILKKNNYSCYFDDSDNRIAYKINNAYKQYYNFVIVLGDKEKQLNTITIQQLIGKQQKSTVTFSKLIEFFNKK